MADIEGPGRPHGQFQEINLENLDFAKINRMLGRGMLFLLLIPLWIAVSWSASFYTDWLWFGSLGYDSVLVTMVTARAALYLGALVLFLALAVPNLVYAFRSTGGTPLIAHPVLKARDYQFARMVLVRVAVVVTALAALTVAMHPATEWETVLLFLNRVPFGQTDPIFGRDFSFFIFTLPAIELLRVWLMSALVTITLIVVAFYYLTSRIRADAPLFIGNARTQIAILAAGVLVLVAAGHWLGRYELLYSPTGAVYGVGFTDNFVNLPGRAALTLIALVSAGLMLLGGLRPKGSNRMFLGALALWVVSYIVIAGALPAAVQRLHVEPAELARERDFLAHNIAFTRSAFGLEALQGRTHPALGRVDPATVADNQGTLQNVRLWDESPLLQSYNQIQFFRLYYDFLAVHTDRYVVDGQLRQVMLATRELSAEKLPTEAQRWVNRRLQFTHGYGVAMSPVTEVEAGGRPAFMVRDVPPIGPIPLERPEVYYGLKSLDYVIVRSGMQEFNYPGPTGPVYTRYEGRGGVSIGSPIRRLLYAWQFRDLNILISGEIEEGSRIQYRRTVQQRFATLSPFLLRDREAYSVVADGRLFWIQDAYTVTDRFPYSTPFGGRFNYMRNSVKAVVDAYHGTVDYYVFEPNDPLIQAYQAIFPGLFRPQAEMPDYLREHVRVPLDQFTVQTQMLLQYHMEDPVVFYNKEDQWSVPVQTSFGRHQPLRPYYIVARLPGEPREEFLLIQPFTPASRHNLVGWMAARSDGENYGELVLFRFPPGRHVDGPSQVEARIDNDAVISEQFTLWGQVGSEVMRGILLVIPLGDALLYAEPVFLRPETLEFPELRRIILADATTVVMHQTLDAAVGGLVGELPTVAPLTDAVEEIGAPARRPAVPQAVDAMRRGLQDAIRRLQQLLDELGEIEGGV
jgi:uncharacterized protein